MIKVVIFDMDGVIFDTIPFAQDAFLKIYPGVTEKMYRELHNGNFHVEVEKYAHLKIQETEEEMLKRYADYAEAKSKAKVFDGMRELLEDLNNKGIILALNTNAYAQNVSLLLERSRIRPLFDLVATAELSKSKVEKFKLIQAKYSVASEEILFITDSLGDVREADVVGIPTVAVTWGAHDTPYFQKESHKNLIGIVNSSEELKTLITKLHSEDSSNIIH